jgi:hypothetical protein
MKSMTSILASPVACLAVLVGIAIENATHVKPEDATAYHAVVKARLDAWPQTIRSGDEEWTSRDCNVPESAVRLLRPNALISRHYECVDDGRAADLLIVQCGEATDMSGHYPRNCYPRNGEKLVHEEPRIWQVGATSIRGMEYHFQPSSLGKSRKCVYNFFVLPGKGIVPDMDDVQRATADYRRRYFGAAQFQVVFDSDLSQPERDKVFATIIGADPDIFSFLNPPGL